MKRIIEKIRHRKDYQGYVISGVFALLLAVHLLNSDVVAATGDHSKSQEDRQALLIGKGLQDYFPLVQTQVVEEVLIERELQLYGRTVANREATIRAQVSAPVEALQLKEGARVAAGDELIRLDDQDLPERLAHVEAMVNQRELEYASAQKLEQKGFQAKLMVADKGTLLADAKAILAGLKNEQGNSRITAPFAGVLNKVYIEQGDYVQQGMQVATVLELNPILVKIHVPETEVVNLKKGQKAVARLLSGEQYEAEVKYISALSDAGTNTFVVELSIANDKFSIPAGISAKVTLYTEKLAASAVSPSLLSLNDDGESGVYVVEDNKAHFRKANIIKSNAKKLWIEGLGGNAQVITAGHQSVADGKLVKVMNQLDLDKRAAF